jgi:hypothetical protein
VLWLLAGAALMAVIQYRQELADLLRREPRPAAVAPAPAQTSEPVPHPPQPAQPPSRQENPSVQPEKPLPQRKPAQRRGGRRSRAAVEEPVVIASNPSPKAPKWRLMGRIIDLVTLKPVEDVDVLIMDPAGLSVKTVSGSDGRFRISLPPNGRGYELKVRHDDYLSKYLLDGSLPYRAMGENARKEEAKKFTRFSPDNPTLFSRGEEKIDGNFYMIPLEKHGKSLEEALQD